MSEKIVQLNEEVIKGQLKELVRGSVEETLNELLEAEAEKLTQAARYERNEQRQGYRSGHYNRNLTTTSGDVTLKVPKLKGISFETAIIERYRRRESSVEEALIEMYLAGVSVRRVEDITGALWGSKVPFQRRESIGHLCQQLRPFHHATEERQHQAAHHHSRTAASCRKDYIGCSASRDDTTRLTAPGVRNRARHVRRWRNHSCAAHG